MAENIVHFAVKSIGLSHVNGRKPCTLLGAARHNLREIQAEKGAAGHIDPRRSGLNRVMAGPATSAGVQELATSLLAASGVSGKELRRDYCQSIEVVFSLPLDSTINSVVYFNRALDWLAVALPLPVLSAVVHQDESASHLHVLLLPLSNGKRVGSSPIERAALKQLRESFFTQVAGPAGLQRQSPKLRGTVKKWAIEAVVRECVRRGLPDKTGELWPVFRAAIERDPLEALQALGIDLNSIRPDSEAPHVAKFAKPIGFERSHVGIEVQADKSRTLSCVGIAHHAAQKLCKGVRINVARMAQQKAVSKWNTIVQHKSEAHNQIDDEGLVRVRDEYMHDEVAAWADY